jgi:phenylacetate-CoA ligase
LEEGNVLEDYAVMRAYEKKTDLAFRSVREIRETQSAMLAEHLRSLARCSPHYRSALKGVDPDSASLETLPTTTKHDLESDSDSFLAVSSDEIAEIATTSGTSGAPLDFAFTEEDLVRLAYNERQALSTCGVKRGDTVLLTCTLDRCFIAGLAYYSGCRAIGATAIRGGANPLESHLELIARLGVNVLVGVPSFLLKLAKFADSNGVDPQSLGVRIMVCIGEPLRDENLDDLPLCAELEGAWGAKAFSTYASTETTTAFCECGERRGGHLIPELGMVEILDDSGAVMPSGDVGEVTVTPFHLEGMPLLRYRTGDLSYLIDEPCACGRNSLRLGPVLGRKYQMIKCKGTSIYPNAIKAALDGMPEVDEYQIRVTRRDLSDDVAVALSLHDSKALRTVEEVLQASLRVKVRLIRESPDALRSKVFPPSARKPLRLVFNESCSSGR